MARLMVTGGAGYIGSHTVRALLAAEHEVVVVDDLSAGHERAVQGATLAVGDVGDRDFVESVMTTVKEKRPTRIESALYYSS